MLSPRVLLAAVACLFMVGGLIAQDVKPDPKEPPRLKGQLPPNYGKLGLSDDQKKAIYKIQADNDVKIEDLESQIKKIKTQEKQDIVKVLTDAQKARLKELVLPEEKK